MKTWKGKFAKFFDREGFYIILFLCVCIVAVTAVWVSRSGINIGEIGNENDSSSVVLTPTGTNVSNEKNSDSEIPTNRSSQVTGGSSNSDNAKSKETSQKSSAVPIKATAETKFKLINPIAGDLFAADVIRGYSPSELVCFDYTGEWRTHSGIDLRMQEGIEVVAAGNGKVVDIRDDNESAGGGLGWTVVIDYGNGYRSVYSNLGEKIAVKKNSSVKSGQVIGTVGNSSMYEKSSSKNEPVESHLHYEVLRKLSKSYEAVDPKDYLTFKK